MSKTDERPLTEKVLHWSLAFSIFGVWLYFENGDAPHRYVGYFAFFTAVVQQVLAIYKNKKGSHKLMSDQPIVAFIVHNFIWIFIGLLALTGWMMSLDRFWGEEWLEELHGTFSWALMFFVALHLVGVFRDSYKYKRATWLHMITKV